MGKLKHATFREWLARSPEDIFGFNPEDNIPPELRRARRSENYDSPIERLATDKIMSELVRMGPIKDKKPQRIWVDTVAYGDRERPGAMSIDISPGGSLRASIRKKAIDLEGNQIWILKKVISLIEQYDDKEREPIGEVGIAYRFFEEIEKADKSQLDVGKNDFKQMEDLALMLAGKARLKHPPVMIYQGIRQHSGNLYEIYFHYTGQGQGGDVPRQGVIEQFSIHLAYEPKRGIIRCWGNEIASPKSGKKWRSMPSEWDEVFVPTQSMQEITSNIIDLFVTY